MVCVTAFFLPKNYILQADEKLQPEKYLEISCT